MAKEIPLRCQKEKGRDLCLFSSLEYSPEKIEEDDDLKISYLRDDEDDRDQEDDLKSNVLADHEYIVRKYYANLYALTKWSKRVRDHYRNDTLDDDAFCKEMEDGTYILGVPAQSAVLEQFVMSLNIEDDEIKHKEHGNTTWIRADLGNLIDCMQLANFLTLPHVLWRCHEVIQEAFPAAINHRGRSVRDDCCVLQSKKDEQIWQCRINFISKLEDLTTDNAFDRVRNLFMIAEFLENQDQFAWYQEGYAQSYGELLIHDCIERIVCGILHVDLNLVDIEKKYKLFQKHFKTGSHAHDTFFRLAIVLFSKTTDKRMPQGPRNQNRAQ